jgi:hypothetical protein
LEQHILKAVKPPDLKTPETLLRLHITGGRRFMYWIIKKGIKGWWHMPYVSKAQEAYFNVNRKKLEAQGVDVDEWNKASKGKKLPQKVKKPGVLKAGRKSVKEK